ncbi:MAG: ribonuclease HII [Bacteriovoracia bacterium]
MTFESQFLNSAPCWLVASDEAGRGPLAGPVVATSVALRLEGPHELEAIITKLRRAGVNDSKKLTAQTRDALAELVGPWTHATVEVDAATIDEINILQASLLAMRTSAEKLVAKDKHLPVVWLIDGHRAPKDAMKDWSIHPIVKGDAKSALIGLASIYAKVHRDHRMQELHRTYPVYGFDRHAGYPTAKHRELIEVHGPSPIHRKTFKGVREFLAR